MPTPSGDMLLTAPNVDSLIVGWKDAFWASQAEVGITNEMLSQKFRTMLVAEIETKKGLSETENVVVSWLLTAMDDESDAIELDKKAFVKGIRVWEGDEGEGSWSAGLYPDTEDLQVVAELLEFGLMVPVTDEIVKAWEERGEKHGMPYQIREALYPGKGDAQNWGVRDKNPIKAVNVAPDPWFDKTLDRWVAEVAEPELEKLSQKILESL